MVKLDVKFRTGIVLFTLGFLSSLLSQLLCYVSLFEWLTLIISISYLLIGWYIFQGYYPKGNLFILIIMGYIYASVFISFAMLGFNLPLAKTIMLSSVFWIFIQILIIFLIRKKLPRRSTIQLLIEVVCLLLLVVYTVLKNN